MNAIARSESYGAYSGQYIGGIWRPGAAGDILNVNNPYSGERIAEIALASVEDLDAAYLAAEAAQRDWADRPASVKRDVFLRAAQIVEQRHAEIVDMIIAESGSTRIKAEIEWASVRDMMLEVSGMPSRVQGRIIPSEVPGKDVRVHRAPLGVIGVISPWNMPMHLSHRSIAPALALGNAVVVKPAEETPISGGLMIAKIYEEAGLPGGLLNVVVGLAGVIGDMFTLHPVPKFISFTGSARVGRHIGQLAMQGSTLKRVGLELGGNAPCVVLDDADLDLAVRGALFGRFLHQGQICMSTNRIIVDASIYDEFVTRFIERASKLTYGDPSLIGTNIGPIISKRQLDGILAKINEAKASGLHLALGGEPQGQVLPPHVFIDVDNNSTLAQSELFGPVVPIIKAHGEEDALKLANQTEFGLSSAVFTRDEGRGLRFAKRIHAGMTHINDISVADSPNAMFGGEKNSGIGRFNSDWVIAEFTCDHLITTQSIPLQYPF
ncbi:MULTISPECIES: aldehyde dehydrogenase family protein [Rhizobium/Agrobacterium group]|uniref:Vanillin: NAD oxidoreductase n=2 Tax=Rhizobium/Agrobacterium group TaxID=227290 RepID=B9K283_ALLAM|nr:MULTISPECIES: aldehyde dehydrogenase family protein [Rhizobium/Agrobacterium group]ACM38981.1 vanillin: NAD oxidoreductase [Allorhizobium ampelinum S4]MCF1449685.1 aldehyde dehydrogenase family protein [Allorhizobium ampelinum]MCF1495192.1 aldehyde dehydrogenase family protein [Allorhizobium ampelinum]MUO31116.1 aldehyde dehydrogenase family protein [Agrobacterium vitis]MUO44546.1 aldehyde dehydrogenase family protein [Agrobacterium vitis]